MELEMVQQLQGLVALLEMELPLQVQVLQLIQEMEQVFEL